MYKLFKHHKTGTLHIFENTPHNKNTVCGEQAYYQRSGKLVPHAVFTDVGNDILGHPVNKMCSRCIQGLFVLGKYVMLVKMLYNAIKLQEDSSEEDKGHPLYIFVMGNNVAYLHQGHATTPEGALQQLQHITDDTPPIAIIEATEYDMYKMDKVKDSFCPACGATNVDNSPNSCTCPK